MINKYVITDEYTVKEAIEKMRKETIKAVVIVDSERQVIGLFSNGDMREFFLKGGNLSEKVTAAMNDKPELYHSELEIEEERKTLKRVIYPIVDEKGRIRKVKDYDYNNTNTVSDVLTDVPLVLMAGGKGTRLAPYTQILPKPLIPIGDVSISERIIDSFRHYGCKDVFMILNYKASMIKAYMSELNKDYNIEYVKEEEFSGTAGGLSLLKDKIKNTFILSNCDILIDDDLECVYKTHKEKGNKITFVCSMKDITIPYGVVETDEDGTIRQMTEKPGFSFLVNTGVYVLEPDVIDEIKDGEFIHMPELAQRYIERGEKVGVFPIAEESWLDMGQFSEMEKMIKALGV